VAPKDHRIEFKCFELSEHVCRVIGHRATVVRLVTLAAPKQIYRQDPHSVRQPGRHQPIKGVGVGREAVAVGFDESFDHGVSSA
jgi:hypothetical protein